MAPADLSNLFSCVPWEWYIPNCFLWATGSSSRRTANHSGDYENNMEDLDKEHTKCFLCNLFKMY